LTRGGVVMAHLPKGRTRLRAVDPHYCKHPKLIPIWKYKRFLEKVFCKCLVCGREIVSTRPVSPTTVTTSYVKKVIRDRCEAIV
jgi:hypothetical protein